MKAPECGTGVITEQGDLGLGFTPDEEGVLDKEKSKDSKSDESDK